MGGESGGVGGPASECVRGLHTKAVTASAPSGRACLRRYPLVDGVEAHGAEPCDVPGGIGDAVENLGGGGGSAGGNGSEAGVTEKKASKDDGTEALGMVG